MMLPFGAAVGYLQIAAPFWLRASGVSLAEIGAVSATAFLPHAWKILWVPLLDVGPYRKRWYAAGVIGTAALLANRTARDDYWNLLRARWREVEERLGGAPMLLRRIVEAVGQLPERRHVLEAEAHFTQHELPQAKMAIAQTMERMRQDAALWEKAGPAISEWLERRGAL
jgi:hypothetical protein